MVQQDISTGNDFKFMVSQCFYEVSVDTKDYDSLYCIGNTTIMVLSGLNTLLFGFLLFLHIQGQRSQGSSCLRIFTKVKTVILELLLAFELIVFLRYSIKMDKLIYNSVLIASQFLQSIILFSICYFFTKKAAHLVEGSGKILRLLKIVMLWVIGISAIIAIFQILYTQADGY